ncbi:MAG TPA: NAD(P)H-dependent oxidoreductase [Thermodesulfobacteriota bacterium]|nr:NAD(P)H-dependent oxidoreductase [Thermodesulfobacteriota bacterium]
MKITVLNGSPKGDLSATMQYVHFIQKKFPQHDLKIFNIAQQIKKIEKDEKAFQEIIDEVKSSQAVLWAFPLYVFLVSSQYKRFIELISEKGVKEAFQNRYTAVLTTSIHFFDHTAHNYMHAICDDLDMKYVGAFSADMYDLLKEKEREKLILFAGNFLEAIENRMLTSKSFGPLTHRKFDYIPGNSEKKIDDKGKKIVILTDSEGDQTSLARMIDRFKRSFSDPVEMINLYNLDIKGGCLGCIRCGHENICIYQDKDGFVEFYNSKLKTADVLIFAGTIKDRYLSSKWKQFFDRGFFNTHTPSLIGKQIGFIISGPLSQIPNLRQILEAYTEWQQANLVDVITDEHGDSAEIDALLQSFAERLIQLAGEGYIKPSTFLGVGAMKIFRDDVWGRLRFPFQADHRFYKKHGIYDFPQKDYKARITNRILILLTKIPSMKKEIYTHRIKAEMIKPFQKILEKKS